MPIIFMHRVRGLIGMMVMRHLTISPKVQPRFMKTCRMDLTVASTGDDRRLTLVRSRALRLSTVTTAYGRTVVPMVRSFNNESCAVDLVPTLAA